MKTFKHFLLEIKFSSVTPAHITHRTNIKGHDVSIWFESQNNGTSHKHYRVFMNVNQHMDQKYSGVDNKIHGALIMRHLKNTMDSFIKTHKPRSIHAESYDNNKDTQSKKHKIYGSMFKYLAKKHGGKHNDVNGDHKLLLPEIKTPEPKKTFFKNIKDKLLNTKGK